jgi:DNA-binding transcriptional regulator YiaG
MDYGYGIKKVQRGSITMPYRALLEFTGTGLKGLAYNWLMSTSPYIQGRLNTPNTREIIEGTAVFEPQSAPDQIRFIQASLGLTVSQLAAVLDVERQTIYNWLQAEQPPALQHRTRTRLANITKIARQWNLRCPRPVGKLASTLDLGSTTFVDLLKQTPINEVALQAMMDALVQHIENARARRQGPLRTSVPPPETADDRILRRATGILLDSPSSEG